MPPGVQSQGHLPGRSPGWLTLADRVKINATFKVAVKGIVCEEFMLVIFWKAVLLLHVPLSLCVNVSPTTT